MRNNRGLCSGNPAAAHSIYYHTGADDIRNKNGHAQNKCAPSAHFSGVSFHNGKLRHTIFGGLHIRSSPNFVCPISSPSQFPPRGSAAFCRCGASNKTRAGGFIEQEQRKTVFRERNAARAARRIFSRRPFIYNFRIQKMGVFTYGFPPFSVIPSV